MSGEWITTHTGLEYRYENPDAALLRIEDIAHALSNLCRFAGHVDKFYSVAEHSVRASYLCPEEDQLAALMHDATETYCVDIPRPLKRAAGMEIYRAYEDACYGAIAKRFGIPAVKPESVHKADVRMLWTEKRDLMPLSVWGDESVITGLDTTPLPEVIDPWSPEQAKIQFLMRFYELTNKKEFYSFRRNKNYEKTSTPPSTAATVSNVNGTTSN
jgi:uncharacterized protein